jgi:uncharacterized protein with GYD domain
MPYFLHQWNYKDAQVHKMVTEPQDRAEIVRIATEAFGGTLHQFFFCLGEFDGVSISEFPDNETALACVMSIFAEGRLESIETTVLFTSEQSQLAMQKARDVIQSPSAKQD